jgi:hypothetical protein
MDGVCRGVVGCYLAASAVSKDMLQRVRTGVFLGKDPTDFLLVSEKDREDLVGIE